MKMRKDNKVSEDGANLMLWSQEEWDFALVLCHMMKRSEFALQLTNQFAKTRGSWWTKFMEIFRVKLKE
jgi:hypothetical protein